MARANHGKNGKLRRTATRGARQTAAVSSGERRSLAARTERPAAEMLRVKTGLAEMLKGGVIMDVTNAEQAAVAERAGAVAVMALERVPADIRKEGGVARMAAPSKVLEIQKTVSIPVMAKCRIGHFAEAQVLEAMEVDFIDESEVLTPADEEHHVDKWAFRVPFVCGARDLGEALRRIAEGAALIRTKGEAGSGNVVEAVRHMRTIVTQMRRVARLSDAELVHEAKELGSPVELVRWIRDHNRDAEIPRLPVPNFAAGGIATPADAALLMQLGAETVFVGSGIFKSSDKPKDQEALARAIVHAVLHYQDAKEVLRASQMFSKTMHGLDVRSMDPKDLLQARGW
jgi:pyridoxal 5'-phosphate synthase pdxS subunit